MAAPLDRAVLVGPLQNLSEAGGGRPLPLEAFDLISAIR